MIELETESQPSNDRACTGISTHSSGVPIKAYLSVEQGMETVPWPGRTYRIRNWGSDQILAREMGKLVLKKEAGLDPCGWRWTCIERAGWLGFFETSSGAYLGHDDKGGFQALAMKHGEWEKLDSRRHPDEGYQLLSFHWGSRKRMAADLKTQCVVEIAGSECRCGCAVGVCGGLGSGCVPELWTNWILPN